MKKIGFVDYYISEWHANNYPAWIANACQKLGADYEVAYAWAELDVSPKYGETTAQWCEQKGVIQCNTLAELCEKSDVIVILAPTDPQTHLKYATEVLKYGKRTYIDKTFAPDLATAQQIFALGKKYNTPFFTSSALRYATETDSYENCRQIIVSGGGSNLPEYIIHLIEMTVKKLGIGAEAIRAEVFGTQTYLHVRYPDDRCATLIFAPSIPYALYMSDGKEGGTRPVSVRVTSSFFDGLIEDMIRFFEDGIPGFDPAETLEVMKLREGAIRASESLGEWITL